MGNELNKKKLSPLRKAMIRNFDWSNHVAAQSTVSIEINMSKFLKIKENLNLFFLKNHKFKLTFLPLLIHMVANTLNRHPALNVELDLEDNCIIYKKDINIGFAVAIQRRGMSGIVLPIIPETNKKNIKEISLLINELSQKAIQGILDITEMQGGTFSISSVGAYGVDFIQPLLTYPQGAILGITRIKEKPIVENGKLAIAPIANFIITVDHRIIDGVPTYEFLTDLKDSIENLNETYMNI